MTKRNLLVFSITSLLFLTGCSQLQDNFEAGKVFFDETVETGKLTVEVLTDTSKQLIEHIQENKDSYNYAKDVVYVSLPLLLTYVDINMLLADPNSLSTNEWVNT